MARETPLIANLTSGELTPRLDGRYDLAWYGNGARIQENLVSLPHGPADRRPGTVFIAEVKDSSEAARLVEFEFNTEQTYQIVFNAGFLQFCKDKGVISAADIGAAIVNGDFPSGIADWDDRSTGTAAIAHDATNQRLSLAGAAASVAWAEQDVATTTTAAAHTLRFEVLGAAGDTVELRVGSTSTGSEILADTEYAVGSHSATFTPGASPFYVQFRNAAAKTLQIDNVVLIDDARVEITMPYGDGALFAIQYVQSNDVLYLAAPGYAVRKLTRFDHSDWSLTELAFQDGPYLDENTDTAKTLQPSATSGLGITITAAGHSPFAATDVGRLVRIKHSTTWGWAIVTAFTSATVVVADVKSNFAGSTAVSEWRLGVFSDTDGHPATVMFHESRLCFAGAGVAPSRADLSQTGGFENFAPGTNDDDPIAYVIGAQKVAAIRWLASKKVLHCGAAGAEFVFGDKNLDTQLTPANVKATPATEHGSQGDVGVQQVDDAVLFVQRHGRTLREIGYSFEADSYVAADLTLRAEHLTRDQTTGRILNMAYQKVPWSVLWAVRADGTLLGLTYVREQKVTAWHRHPLGGGGAVESVATIAGAVADELWMIVNRTINGATVRHVELLDDWPDDSAALADFFYVDDGLTYDGAATATITGLDHLEGESVQILADGAVHPNKTVSSGVVTLDYAAAKVHLGLGSMAKLQPVRPDAGAREGTAQTKTKRIDQVAVRLDRSLGMKVGRDANSLAVVPFRNVTDPMDSAPPLFTGDKIIGFDSTYETPGDTMIVQDLPLPLTVVCLVPRVRTEEG